MQNSECYLLFAYSQYYPEGGAHDFIASYPTLDEAKAALWEYDLGHIAVLEDGKLKVVHGRTISLMWGEWSMREYGRDSERESEVFELRVPGNPAVDYEHRYLQAGTAFFEAVLPMRADGMLDAGKCLVRPVEAEDAGDAEQV